MRPANMQSLTAAHALAQRSSACLARSAASARSRALYAAAAATSPARYTSAAAANLTARPSAAAVTATTPARPSSMSRRAFSQSVVRPKKGGGKKDKAEKPDKRDKRDKKGGSAAAAGGVPENDTADDADDAGVVHPQADPADPFTFADVESRWQRTDARHEDKFKELRRTLGHGVALGGGGAGEASVDVEAIGATPVKEGGESTPLAQLALVIPRAGGRLVELRMHTPASRKAIVRAVQASPLFRGQQPQPDPDDELVLVIKLGGSTSTTSSDAADLEIRRVRDLANAWRAQIRRTTARRQKTHQTWKRDGSVRPDDLHRLDKELLKAQEKRMARIDAAEKETLRQLEQSGRR